MILTNKLKSREHATGFSLIELLIGMTIGLFLLAGIATSYVSSKKSSVTRDQLSILEDNGRIALEIISQAVQHAGYTPPLNASPLNHHIITDVTDVVSGACTDGSQSIVDTSIFSKVTADSATSDSLAVVYYGDDNIFTDCGGGALPNVCRVVAPNSMVAGPVSDASKIYSAFFLVGDKLSCAGSQNNTIQIVAEDIENIQFLYGVKDGSENIVERYINASDLSDDLLDDVVSIQVAVLVKSQNIVKTTPEQEIFTLLDEVVTAPNDRYQRAVFSTTIRLRNTL